MQFVEQSRLQVLMEHQTHRDRVPPPTEQIAGQRRWTAARRELDSLGTRRCLGQAIEQAAHGEESFEYLQNPGLQHGLLGS